MILQGACMPLPRIQTILQLHGNPTQMMLLVVSITIQRWRYYQHLGCRGIDNLVCSHVKHMLIESEKLETWMIASQISTNIIVKSPNNPGSLNQ